ncbi:MAG: endonuclease domain-containing protein [Anaerolineales bacterium]
MSNSPRRRWRTSANVLIRARQLRREMTPAERKLWQRLRRGQLDGARFRKQHPVGRFILDFFCARSKLVIEIDGDTHVTQMEYDAERTQWLSEQKDYRVIRFTNDEVHHNLVAVLERIREALRE